VVQEGAGADCGTALAPSPSAPECASRVLVSLASCRDGCPVADLASIDQASRMTLQPHPSASVSPASDMSSASLSRRAPHQPLSQAVSDTSPHNPHRARSHVSLLSSHTQRFQSSREPQASPPPSPVTLHTSPINRLRLPRRALCSCEADEEESSHWRGVKVVQGAYSRAWRLRQANGEARRH
jgi:hypothetical protein